MNVFKKVRARLRLWDAVRQADIAHAETGNRYYVMPLNALDDKLIVMDRRNFRIIRRKGYITKQAKILNVEKECFYCTSYCNGTGALSPADITLKRKQYFAWLEHVYVLKSNLRREKVRQFFKHPLKHIKQWAVSMIKSKGWMV